MELQGCYKLEFMCIDIAVGRSWCRVCPFLQSQFHTAASTSIGSVCVCMCARVLARMYVRVCKCTLACV